MDGGGGGQKGRYATWTLKKNILKSGFLLQKPDTSPHHQNITPVLLMYLQISSDYWPAYS